MQVNSVSNPKVLYSELSNILKEYQLEEHEKFLSKFLDLFRQIDLDKNGIISNQEFNTLYHNMSIKIQNVSLEDSQSFMYK